MSPKRADGARSLAVTAPPIRTIGVDLAAGPERTALAVVEWNPWPGRGEARAWLEHLMIGVDDASIVRTVTTAGVGDASGTGILGIDCALGWPDDFVAFVAAHADLRTPPTADGGSEWRKTLAYRETDRAVHGRTGRWPLSVSADRLGLTAMRCAGLLRRLADAGVTVDRSGLTGSIVEVYPAATLRLWGWNVTGYKTDAAARRDLVARMNAEAPWFDLGGHAEVMVQSADAFDAVIAALTARAASAGQVDPIPAEHVAQAQREGWIALPTGGLAGLAAA